MTKLYKAIDKLDGSVSGFLVNSKGVAVTTWCCCDEEEVTLAKKIRR